MKEKATSFDHGDALLVSVEVSLGTTPMDEPVSVSRLGAWSPKLND
jgi:hypothetical protein